MRLLGAIALACALAPRGAAAEDYAAPPGCPDERAFWGAVRARSLEVPSSTVALGVEVSITSSAASLRGAVRLSGGAPRVLEGRSCPDLVSALALVTALLIDATPRASPPRSPLVPRPESPPGPAPRERGADVSLGAGVALGVGALPDVALSVPVFVELAWASGARARAGFRAAGRSADAASFTLYAAELQGCYTIPLGALALLPCASVEAGALLAEPTRADLSSSSPSRRPHVAAGAALHLRAPLLDPIFVELGGAASGVFTRARYAFNPGLVLVHEVGPAKGELGVLVGVTIP